MGRKQKTILDTTPVIEENTIETTQEAIVGTPRILEDLRQADAAEKEAILEIEEQIALGNSKVKPHYKKLYRDRARAAQIKGKAAKRSTWDWLAKRMAEICLTDKAKLKLPEFEALMAANGIDTNQWPSRSPGWEGRLRMTGGLVLRRKLAETGVLYLADGSTEELPAEEFAALQAKFSL